MMGIREALLRLKAMVTIGCPIPWVSVSCRPTKAQCGDNENKEQSKHDQFDLEVFHSVLSYLSLDIANPNPIQSATAACIQRQYLCQVIACLKSGFLKPVGHNSL
jgi:hypothetical protein